MLALTMGRSTMVLFQSTPANTGGRCNTVKGAWPACSGFNPRPPILAGDASAALVMAVMVFAVSIHARQYWRAMPAWPSVSVSSSLFQSTPANTGGRCAAMVISPREWSCFNPRPPILAGDAMMPSSSIWSSLMFQSTPANTGGRCVMGYQLRANCLRFNPRPPILAGDAQHALLGGELLEVSIHARQYWRAMHGLQRPRQPQQVEGFNPRPPILAGDALNGDALIRSLAVSIHARQYWRAMLMAAKPASVCGWFQSTPANTGGRCARGR